MAPIVDVVELLDDLWFGAPNWFPPYVESPLLGGPASSQVLAYANTSEVSCDSQSLSSSESSLMRHHSLDRKCFDRGNSLKGWVATPFRQFLGRRSSRGISGGGLSVNRENSVSCSFEPTNPNRQKLEDFETTIGTWAERQTSFRVRQSLASEPESGAHEAAAEQAKAGSGQQPQKDDDSESRLQSKAWEWRFRQRWAKEHWLDPAARDLQDDDGLAFVQQHGMHGWQQQFAIRDVPEHGYEPRENTADRSVSQDLMFGTLVTPTPDARSGLLRMSSIDTQHADGGEATRKILQAAHQANELLLQQKQIEADVHLRWEACVAEDSQWAGQHLTTCIFDLFGEMPLFLMKAEHERQSRRKYVVRAKHKLQTPEDAQRSLLRELQSIADEHGYDCCGTEVTVLGECSLRWGEDASLRITPRNGSAGWSDVDAAGLAVSLLCQTASAEMEVPEGHCGRWMQDLALAGGKQHSASPGVQAVVA